MKKTFLSLTVLLFSLAAAAQVDAAIDEKIERKIASAFTAYDTILVRKINKAGSFYIDTLNVSDDIVNYIISIKVVDAAGKASARKLIEVKKINGVITARDANQLTLSGIAGITWALVKKDNVIYVAITSTKTTSVSYKYYKIKENNF